MTNLYSPRKNNNILNPENAVIFLPIIISLAISGILIGAVVTPLMNRLSKENAKIKVLEDKILLIPIYKKYIKEITFAISKANSQQRRLIKMISDPNKLETLLSEINRISLKNNIEVIEVIPKPLIKYKAKNSKAKNKNKKLKNKKIDSRDPFLLPDIQKHTHQIKLSGNYSNIIDFLKDIESLQTIVISKNLEIKEASRRNDTNSENQANKLGFTFELDTYAYTK